MNWKRASLLGLAACVAAGSVVGGLKAQSSAGQNAAAAQSAASTSAATAEKPKMAEEQYKNIKVLDGVPADQVIPAMQFITISLGVECSFCHVQGANGKMEFDRDDKKNKDTARKMMEMMFAINKDNFKGRREVTCYSCHRGSAEPKGTPAVMTGDARVDMIAAPTEGADEKPPAAGPAADQLIDKYVKAVGGAAAIDKITSRVGKGTIEFGDKSFPIDLYAKDPYKRISFTHMPEGDNVTAFNGQEGWLGMSGHAMREMHGPDIDGATIDADLHLAVHLKGMFRKVSTEGTGKIGDANTFVVVGEREDKPPLRLYFDAQSGLLVRLVRFGETPLGQLPTQIDYADYRVVDGVKVPFRWTLARPNGRFTIQLSELKQNVPVDDAKFAKPTPPAAPQGLGGQVH